MVVNALRFFGMSDMAQIEDMYLDEYFLRLEAAQLRSLDADRRVYMQAWVNQAAKATRGSRGKPKYESFDDFFDNKYRADERRIRGRNNRGLRRRAVSQAELNRRRNDDFQAKLAELERGESDGRV